MYIFFILTFDLHTKIVFFFKIFIILLPLPRQHWAAIGCSENGQPEHPVSVKGVGHQRPFQDPEIGNDKCLINVSIRVYTVWSKQY